MGNTDNYDFSIKTNNSARLHLEGSGNIGINTLTPGSSLEVKGKTLINDYLAVKKGFRIDLTGISCTTAEMLIIDGKIGINNTNLTYDIGVNGTIEASSFSGSGSLITNIIFNYPENAISLHDESTVITGGPLYRDWDDWCLYCMYALQGPASNGDTFMQKFHLKKVHMSSAFWGAHGMSMEKSTGISTMF